MKSFAPKPWVVPQPVLIIGTYNKDGVANAMNAAWAGQWDMKGDYDLDGKSRYHRQPKKLAVSLPLHSLPRKPWWLLISWALFLPRTMQKRWRRQDGTSRRQTMVNAPVFTDFPMTLECRIKEKIDESEEGYYIVAEIVNILVDENYLAEDGKPDMEKMELIVFDPIHHGYIELGKTIGKAFSDGKALK
jgi:flavin reductase (DIM6/NTAB) family NADH-FMN oxidoreductase RutF